MPHLKEPVLQRLRDDESLQLDIAKALVKKVSTVKTWIRYSEEYQDILTSKAMVLVLKDITGLTEDQIIERAAVAA